jgi:hypothetical protein
MGMKCDRIAIFCDARICRFLSISATLSTKIPIIATKCDDLAIVSDKRVFWTSADSPQ